MFAVTGPETAAASVLRTEVGGAVTVGARRRPAAPRSPTSSPRCAPATAPVADAAALARYDMSRVTADLAAVLDRLAAGGDH